MLNVEVYNFVSIALRNRDVLLERSYITERMILQMMENSNIRKTKGNIEKVKDQIISVIKNGLNSKVEVKQSNNDIIIYFKS